MMSLARRLVTFSLAALFATLGAMLSGDVTTPTANAVAMAALVPSSDLYPAASATITPARIEERTFWSESLQRSMPYLVFLPPDYDLTLDRTYPVLYMLHGRGGSYRSWHELGLPEIADRLIRAGDIQPFLIVMPEGENAYWVNHADKGPRWGDYIGRDLVQEIDSQFRTTLDRESRAVGGLSMGGCGALQLAINYADTFGIVGAHSPAFRTHETAPSYFGDLAYFNTHSPVPLFKTRTRVAKSLKIYIDMGQQDTWYDAARAFHQQLDRQGVAHQWRERLGGHDGNYWQGYSPEYLRYYSQSFATPISHLSYPGSNVNQTISTAGTTLRRRRNSPPTLPSPLEPSEGVAAAITQDPTIAVSPLTWLRQFKLNQAE